jgi:hypothetical protein
MHRTALLASALALLSSCATVKAAPAEKAMPSFPPLPASTTEESPPGPALMVASAEPEAERAPTLHKLADAAASVLAPGRDVAMDAPAHGPAMAQMEASAAPREMLDIEATLNIVVEQIATAAAELRTQVRQHGGVLVDDVVDESSYGSGRFLIRIAAPGTDEMMAALERLGQVRSRQVQARDIGKQYLDAQLQLENLNVAMARYEQILAKAERVADILSIERELTRLRGEIEHVKGNLRWMKDRVARSTIHVNLVSPHLAAVQGPVEPQAKFYPSLRLAFAEDMRGNNARQSYLGGGISLRANRAFSLDLDGLRRTSTGSPIKGLDIFMITMGGESYSEFLGNGTRRFANPYLGWRLGYARFLGNNEFALGATVGLELVKTRYLGVDVAVRGIGLIGHSAHLAVEPDLTIRFAF